VRSGATECHTAGCRDARPDAPRRAHRFEGAVAEALPHGGDAAWQQLRQRAAVLLAFEQLGSAEAALEMARTYALDRTAFGRKIGFVSGHQAQAGRHVCKNRACPVHCYYGAWAISTDAPETRWRQPVLDAAPSTLWTTPRRRNIQIHGGIGVTWESDCQLFYAAQGTECVDAGLAL